MLTVEVVPSRQDRSAPPLRRALVPLCAVLTHDDIPEPYRGHRVEPGPRFHRLAAGLLDRLGAARGTRGTESGHRLVQSAWHLRYAGVGQDMHRLAPSISGKLREDDQFVYLSGFQLAVTSAMAAIDLCAAALAYLAGHEQREPDFRSLTRSSLLGRLTPPQRDWVTATDEIPDVGRFIDVRNALVHRHVPTSVVVRLGGLPSYSIRVDEVAGEIPVDPVAAYCLAVDRFVALGLTLLDETK